MCAQPKAHQAYHSIHLLHPQQNALTHDDLFLLGYGAITFRGSIVHASLIKELGIAGSCRSLFVLVHGADTSGEDFDM